jgi:hypothetical protein
VNYSADAPSSFHPNQHHFHQGLLVRFHAMPECIEIAAVATQLRALLLHSGQTTTIEAAQVSPDSAPCTFTSPFPILTEIVEHGKELEFRLSTGGSLVVHFMLTGYLATSSAKQDELVGSITTVRSGGEAQEAHRVTLFVCDPSHWALVRYYATETYVEGHWRAQAPAIWCSPEQRAQVTAGRSATAWATPHVIQERVNRLILNGKSIDLKKQHGPDAVCSGMGKWLIWQYQEELSRWRKQRRAPKQQPDPQAPTKQQSQRSLHAFFGGGGSSNKSSAASHIKAPNVQGYELFEIVDGIAHHVYDALLKEHKTIEALFAGYASTRRAVLAAIATSSSGRSAATPPVVSAADPGAGVVVVDAARGATAVSAAAM